jgi:antitoxin component YwqK of YwqJK toxin-antitoxin module
MHKIIAAVIIALFTASVSRAQKFNIYNGDTINRVDAKGLKQGKWLRFYADTSVFSEGQFKNGKPYGTHKLFYQNGNLKSELHYLPPDNRKSTMISYHENGKIMARGNYQDQKKDSIWNYYGTHDSLTATESYKGGMKQGPWKIYYDNGKISEEVSYVADKKSGLHRMYFKEGTLKLEAIYKNGRYEGQARIFHPNGKIWMNGIYAAGVKEGTWMIYDESGKKMPDEIYKEGILELQFKEDK